MGCCWTATGLVAMALMVGSCLSTDLSRCPSGLACPDGFGCAPLLDQCIRRDRLNACAEPELDGLPCAVGSELGVCQRGACLSGCGDSVVDAELDEECEEQNFAGARCEDFTPAGGTSTFYAGELACQAGCTLDFSGCSGYCGDGAVSGPETCDGELLPVETCADVGYHRGRLACSERCDRFTDLCSVVTPSGLPGFSAGGSSTRITAIEATSAVDLTVGTSQGQIFHYDGIAWRRSSPGAGEIEAIAAVGSRRYALTPTALLVSEDTGLWQIEAANVNEEFVNFWAHEDVVLAVSSETGKVMRLADGVWELAADLTELGFDGPLLAIWGRNAQDVYVAGYDLNLGAGTYFHFDGTRWTVFGSEPGKVPIELWGTADALLVVNLNTVERWTEAGWEELFAGSFGLGSHRLRGVSSSDFYVHTASELIHFQNGRTDMVPLDSEGGLAVLGPWHAIVGVGGVASEYRGIAATHREAPTQNFIRGLWAPSPDLVYFIASDPVAPTSAAMAFFSYDHGTISRLCDNGIIPAPGTPDCAGYGLPNAIWGRSPTEMYIGVTDLVLLYSGVDVTIELDTGNKAVKDIHGSDDVLFVLAGSGVQGQEIYRIDAASQSVHAVSGKGSLLALFALNSALAYAVGNGGRVDRYTEAGGWETDVAPEIPDEVQFRDVLALAPDDVVAVGNNAIFEFDGLSWNEVVFGPNEGATAIDSNGTDVIAVSASTAWVRRNGAWTRFALPLSGFVRDIGLHPRALLVGSGNELVRFETRVPWAACAATEARCDDQIDDDCNGLVDGEDPACL